MPPPPPLPRGSSPPGVLGWLAYGLLAAQPAVFAANVVTITLIVALTLLKTRPRRPPERPRR